MERKKFKESREREREREKEREREREREGERYRRKRKMTVKLELSHIIHSSFEKGLHTNSPGIFKIKKIAKYFIGLKYKF